MKLFTKEIDKKLAAQYHLGADLNAQMVVAKIFNPYGNGRWFLVNSDPADPDYLWAIVQIGDVVEVGSVSRKELERLRVGRFGFPLERDLGFSQRNAQEVYNGLLNGKFYAKGGMSDTTDSYAVGGLTPGRWYKDNQGVEYKFIGKIDNGPDKDKLLFNDGTKSMFKTLDEFGEKPKENKLFGWFEKGGEVLKKYGFETIDDAVKALKSGDISTTKFMDILYEYEVKGKGKLEDGGSTEEGVDLFEDYENIPSNVQLILDKYADQFENGNYKLLEKVQKEIEKEGYTFDYGLDASAYNLRKIGQKGKYDDYANGGKLKKNKPQHNQEAYELGSKAFLNGQKRVAFYDKKLSELIKKNGGTPKTYIDFSDSWMKGWDSEFSKVNYLEMADGGKLNIGTIKKTDTDVLFDKKSGKFYANVIDGLGNRINKLNVNTIDDLFEDYPTFRLNTTGEKEFPESMSFGGFLLGAAAGAVATNLLSNKKQDNKKSTNDDYYDKSWKEKLKEQIEYDGFDDAVTDFDEKTNDKKFETLKNNYLVGTKKFKQYIQSKNLVDEDYDISVKDAIEKEGFDYALNGYNDWKGVKNSTFQNMYEEYKKLRLQLGNNIRKEGNKMADGGMVTKYNVSFNYNPSNLKNKDAEKIVEAYTKDWKHDNDFDEVSFFAMRLNKEDADSLVKELKMEDVYNIEVDKSSYADGGKVKFADKVKSIQASLLKRKKVAPSVQKDYGKTYNKAEAKESAKRIVGAMTAKERLMAKKKK